MREFVEEAFCFALATIGTTFVQKLDKKRYATLTIYPHKLAGQLHIMFNANKGNQTDIHLICPTKTDLQSVL